jgi:ATP-dependent helicase/nuclease subunit A
VSAPRAIPDAVLLRQAEAADPAASAFVAANAGSGKTHVLAQRVIRLLLDGVDPAKILCITFTKAAAANMASRVFDELGQWIALDDAALDAALRRIGVKALGPARRARARRLFAAALETPGGLKVQTIHAFCTRLLQQFPFEANVAARFSVLDERASDELLDRATLSALLDAAADSDSPLGRALATAVTAAADVTFREVVREAIGRRSDVVGWVETAGGVEAAIAQLSRALGLGADDTLATIETDIVEGPILPLSEWAAAAAIFMQGSANDQKQAGRLSTALASGGSARVTSYLEVFFGGNSEARDSLMTKPLAKRFPSLAEKLGQEQARVRGFAERRNGAICRDRSAALLTIAHEVIARYETEKRRRGALDYEDLIDKTLAMLAVVHPTWVHYKLDLGIDHVLIDEAQDTSPKQWEIIKALVAEFAAGAGARGAITRSIFAVGDEKQSIFSFQGAAPQEFEAMRQHFDRAFGTAGLAFRRVRLFHSFRSGANVLGAVDEVFQAAHIHASITSDEAGMPPHEALPDAAPGVVEIWPLVKADKRPDIEGWDAPFDALAETSPPVTLAQSIARGVRAAIDDGTAGAVRPGDILVLVRQRGALFEAIIRALKDANIAVAGADRLVLTEHIAVIDLMALADALLCPADDLALAIALKSPLFGFDDDLLFELAHDRRGTLRAALAGKSGERAPFAAAQALIARCEATARNATPFAFFAWLLGAEGGRARILARLGFEAADALDEFLQLALDYERRETPSLQGFLAWLRAAPTEIKRDMEMTRDEVRVMTVHGAKGLEAPVVILADTTTPPTGPRPPRLLALPVAGAPAGLVWAGRKDTDVAAVAAARAHALAEAENEYRRLLYVAMTRAADRLIVCGYEGLRARSAGCWYDLVVQGLEGKDGLALEPAGDGEEPIRIYRKFVAEPREPASAPARAPAPPGDEPGWLRRPAPAEPERPAVLSPSLAVDEATLRSAARKPAGEARDAALARGRLVHRLMQSLPEIAPDRRAAAARQFLARSATALDAAACERLVSETLAILDDARFAPLFAEGSRAEVPIVGRLKRDGRPPILVSGQVDRLVVTRQSILIADFKTNRPAPRRIEEVPEGYVAQLALYRAVLALLYPGRPVRAALVFTDVPDLMELSADALDAALARVTCI